MEISEIKRKLMNKELDNDILKSLYALGYDNSIMSVDEVDLYQTILSHEDIRIQDIDISKASEVVLKDDYAILFNVNIKPSDIKLILKKINREEDSNLLFGVMKEINESKIRIIYYEN